MKYVHIFYVFSPNCVFALVPLKVKACLQNFPEENRENELTEMEKINICE